MKKINLIVMAAALAVTSVTTTAWASPAEYDWRDATPASWSNTDDYTGPMIWGQIADTVSYGGSIWVAGGDANHKAALWRYDETTGNWTNELPSAIAEGDHVAVSTLAVYGGKLYLATDNSSSADKSEMWSKSSAGAPWTKVTSYDTLAAREATSMIVYGSDLCVAGAISSIRVWCFNGTSWTNTDIGSSGAFYPSYRSGKLAVAGGKLYIDAQTGDDYYGIWSYNGTTWTHVETPFTDEEEDSENPEAAHYLRGLGAFDGKVISVSVDTDTEITHVWQYDGTTWTQLGDDNFDGDEAYYNRAVVSSHAGKLVIGAGGYGMSARIWQYDAETNSFAQVNQEYFDMTDTDGFEPQFVTSLTSSGGVLFAATGADGEGQYFPQLWRSQPLVVSDNGNNSESNVLPNGGDLNNDGTVDSEQDHVVSFKNEITDKYVALEVSDECTINTAMMKRISELNGRDSAFEYVNGLMDFDVSCGDPGFTATVTQYYYDVAKNDLVLRKHMPTTNAFFTVPGATTEQLTIGGRTVTKATYQVTDGGDLDVDGTVNGVIVDPAGLARNVVGVPRTGLGGK